MIFDDMIDKDFSGCVSITEDGKTVFEKAFGYADLSNKISNETDTKFASASAGKVFVAAAILQLIERGLLHFDDTIGSRLDLDWKQIDKNITVRQLLCHTSGIPDYFDESVMTEYEELWKDYPNYKIRTSSDIIPLFINKPMMYPAGAKFQYNNTGYVVLGLLIEKLTGDAFDVFLKKNIFDPAQMTDTGYYELDRLPAHCAGGYLFDEKTKSFYSNIYSVDAKGTGAGGAFITVKDIQLFWESLFAGRLVSAEMLHEMLSPQSGDGKFNYGYGVWLQKTGDRFIPYFQGSDPGVSFVSAFYPDRGICFTAVSNFGCNVWKLRREIMNAAGELFAGTSLRRNTPENS